MPEGIHRDVTLGTALRDLEVPEHGLEFYVALYRCIEEERTARVAEARTRRRSRQRRIRWTTRLAAVAAVVSAAAVVGLPRLDTGPETATAAEIKQRLTAALAAADSLAGSFVTRRLESSTEAIEVERGTFLLTAGGDFRLEVGTRTETYDARKGVYRSVETSEQVEGGQLAQVLRGVAPGPPDSLGAPGDFVLERRLGSVVRALLAANDPRVTEATYRGRKVWVLETPVEPNKLAGDYSSDHLAATIDQKTGLPVRAVWTLRGSLRAELEIVDLVVDPGVPREAFELEPPTRIAVFRQDLGFRHVPLARVESVVGYAPLVPSSIPEGYELTAVAAAQQGGVTGAEGMNPPARGVVSLSYRRGLDQFTVTTRVSDARAQGEPELPVHERWSDPLATGEGFVDNPEHIVIRGGALEGVRAELLIVPRGVPHVWALGDGLVVTVAGELNRAELLEVISTLRRQR